MVNFLYLFDKLLIQDPKNNIVVDLESKSWIFNTGGTRWILNSQSRTSILNDIKSN